MGRYNSPCVAGGEPEDREEANERGAIECTDQEFVEGKEEREDEEKQHEERLCSTKANTVETNKYRGKHGEDKVALATQAPHGACLRICTSLARFGHLHIVRGALRGKRNKHLVIGNPFAESLIRQRL